MTEISSDQTCEWDSDKRQINIEKHGIDFDKITEVFNDMYFQFWYDEENSSSNEDRFRGLGEICGLSEINGIVIFVSYTEINNRYRIISAREATSKEKEAYYGNIRKINGI